MGAWVRDDLDVVHAGFGRTWFGRAPGSTLCDRKYTDTLAELDAAGLGAEDVRGEILRHLWFKLAANAVINPITSLREVRNGGVPQTPEGMHTVQKVCEELGRVSLAWSAQHASTDQDQ